MHLKSRIADRESAPTSSLTPSPLSALSSQFSPLPSQHSALSAQLSPLLTQPSALSSQLSPLPSQHSALSSQLSPFPSQHSALSSQHSSRAFTLIELLVVIAIVAILAAILFPVFAQAKMAAKKSASLSNLHQIGLAWGMYGDDYDNMLMRVHEADGTKDIYWWASWDGTTLNSKEGLLSPFIGSKGVEADPTFDNKLRTVLDLTGYGYNYAYLSPSAFNPPDYTEEAIPVSEGQIGTPAETVAFATCARMNNWAYATPTLEGSTYLDPPSNDFPGFHGRSNGVGNILWCDGHANSRRPQLRTGTFGFGFDASDFRRENLGDIDKDSDLTTDELFDLN